ncbi:nucleolar protein 12-domain-containing protein [Phlebopus sp. FC_14]|nr:nucleolar protein 12-domain-containing protein [Phlebopus sp. FC_14]
MQHNNLSILTQSHKAIAAKKRAKKDQIKEIVFDEDARREFLTGFHKRKVAKKEAAKKTAQLRERQERLESRREQRRALAERAARNAAEVEKAYGAVIDDKNDEWGRISDDSEKEIEEEYEGEEQLATVTVVEDFDPSALLHGQPTTSAPPADRNVALSQSSFKARGKEKERLPIHAKSKVKRNDKVKYQTKAARSAERSKQRARRTEKAERAGGKASRKRKRR